MSNPYVLTVLFIVAAILPLIIIGCSLIFVKMTVNIKVSIYATMCVYLFLAVFSLVNAIYSYLHHAKSSELIPLWSDSILWFVVALVYYLWARHYGKNKKGESVDTHKGA
jgi:branched-subunit amino acid permease